MPDKTLPLPDDVTQCHAIIRELSDKLKHLQALTEKQKHQLLELLRHRFGQRSDRMQAEQLVLWALDEVESTPAGACPAEKETPARPGLRGGHGRKPLPQDLPRKRVEHPVPAEQRTCSRCGSAKKRFGEEVSEQLEYVPASLYVIEHVCPKYACPHCEEGVARGMKPMQPIEKGLPGPGLLAHVVTSKYADHLPLNRLEGILARHGVEIARSTMCDWAFQCARLVEPLYRVMHQRILGCKVLHTDDTPVPVLDPSLTQTRTGRIWTYVGDVRAPYTVFDYTASRKRDGPETFLAGFQGYLQADAYAGYEVLYRTGKIFEVACWAHARRKFKVAEATAPMHAVIAAAWIRRLYRIEEAAKLLSPEARQSLRQEKAKPILGQFRPWLENTLAQVLPKSPMGEAISYSLSNWDALNRYLEDGELAIDNNRAERVLRGPVVGRNNWLFFGSDRGGRTAAVLMSFVATCKDHGIDPFLYLRDVFERISAHPASRIEDLLPDRWLAIRQAEAAEQTPIAAVP
jgi:transposase